MQKALVIQNQLFIHQKRELTEALMGLETRNRYEVFDPKGVKIGMLEEESFGFSAFMSRLFYKSHRQLKIKVYNAQNIEGFNLTRNFFFIFSDLFIKSSDGKKIGSVHRRFSFLNKKYDLFDQNGRLFARIQAPFYRIWKFPILDLVGSEVGEITKKWRSGKWGVLTEMFTDADTFLVNYGLGNWSPEQKLVIFAAAISIDFDYFENNVRGIGFFDS